MRAGSTSAMFNIQSQVPNRIVGILGEVERGRILPVCILCEHPARLRFFQPSLLLDVNMCLSNNAQWNVYSLER